MGSVRLDQPRSRRDLLRGAGAGTALLLLGPLAGCGGRQRAARPEPSYAGPTRDVTAFGAVGDGHTDDTAAVSRGLHALRGGESLHFPAGRTFLHGDVLHVPTAGVRLVGSGTLQATAEERSSLQLDADDITVDGLRLTTPHTSKRWSAPDQHKLVLGQHRGIVVRNVSITGSAAAGVFCQGAYDFTLDRVSVTDTRADGIHLTDGTNSGQLLHPVITRSGDDGVAVVSYLQDHVECHDITITGPTIRTTTGGRGLSVVGGRDITYTGIDVDDSNAAAVYIACEGSPYFTYPSQHVRVTGGVITHANSNPDIDHGAVLVYSGRSGGGVCDVTISGLAISGTRPSASRQIGVVNDNGNPVSDVHFNDLKLAADPRPYQGNAPSAAFSLHKVTADGAPLRAPA